MSLTRPKHELGFIVCRVSAYVGELCAIGRPLGTVRFIRIVRYNLNFPAIRQGHFTQLPLARTFATEHQLFAVPRQNRAQSHCSRSSDSPARTGDLPSGGKQGYIGISFFQQHLQLALDRPKKPNRRAQLLNPEEPTDTRLCLSILKGWASEETLAIWQDDDAQKLEARMTEIAIQLILIAEIK